MLFGWSAVRNVLSGNTIASLTNHLLDKPGKKGNILIFTDVSPSEDLVYVKSLDSNIYKHMWKSVHQYFWLNCNVVCCGSLPLFGLCTLVCLELCLNGVWIQV